MHQVLWPLGGMLLTQTVASIVFLAVPVLAPEIAPAIGVEPATVGFYSSLVFLAAMFVSAAVGPVIRRFGAVRMNLAGLALSSLGLLLALPAMLPLLVLSALTVGTGYGPNTPTGSHVLAKVTPPRLQGLVFSIKQSGASLGGMIGGLLIPAVAVAAGWQAAIWTVCGLGLAAAVAVMPLSRRLDTERDPTQRLGLGQVWIMVRPVLTRPALRRLTAMSFAFTALQMTLFTYFVTYLVAEAGFDLVRAGIAFSAMQVAGAVGRVLWGWVADRTGSGRLVLALLGVGSLASIVALVLTAHGGSLLAVAAVGACCGATVSGWNGVFLAEVVRGAGGAEIGAATGGVLFFTYAGLVVGPTLFAAALKLTGSYDAMFVAFATATTVAGAGMLWRFPKLQREGGNA
ncbi:MAG: MFS transporter [Alphaproteobacteria bacterium]